MLFSQNTVGIKDVLFQRWLRSNTIKILSTMLIGVFLVSCARTFPPAQGGKLKEGELPLTADYKFWPVYLHNVQRPDVKQVRDIYINATGAKNTAAKLFTIGTV